MQTRTSAPESKPKKRNAWPSKLKEIDGNSSEIASGLHSQEVPPVLSSRRQAYGMEPTSAAYAGEPKWIPEAAASNRAGAPSGSSALKSWLHRKYGASPPMLSPKARKDTYHKGLREVKMLERNRTDQLPAMRGPSKLSSPRTSLGVAPPSSKRYVRGTSGCVWKKRCMRLPKCPIPWPPFAAAWASADRLSESSLEPQLANMSASFRPTFASVSSAVPPSPSPPPPPAPAPEKRAPRGQTRPKRPTPSGRCSPETFRASSSGEFSTVLPPMST
mmetsp:Transcript_80622/g.209930  ORF Transcript_80622/g.209930 Transcript_80622/m.209930 type:complete len:274 (-) Transcript_80622:452-1273(-)